jgi:hypothetical protein
LTQLIRALSSRLSTRLHTMVVLFPTGTQQDMVVLFPNGGSIIYILYDSCCMCACMLRWIGLRRTRGGVIKYSKNQQSRRGVKEEDGGRDSLPFFFLIYCDNGRSA